MGVFQDFNSIYWEYDVSSSLAKGWNIIPTPNPTYFGSFYKKNYGIIKNRRKTGPWCIHHAFHLNWVRDLAIHPCIQTAYIVFDIRNCGDLYVNNVSLCSLESYQNQKLYHAVQCIYSIEETEEIACHYIVTVWELTEVTGCHHIMTGMGA